jgi:hypothetical protein
VDRKWLTDFLHKQMPDPAREGPTAVEVLQREPPQR